MKLSSTILALFLGFTSTVEGVQRYSHHRASYSPLSFAEAAADAKQRAGDDSYAWKENFEHSRFYREYQEH